MSTQVTVTLQDDIYRRAEYLARLTGRDIADILAETIDLSLRPLGMQDTAAQPVADLSDAEVLSAAESQMDPVQAQRFEALLEKQQAGQLADEERSALLALLQVYQDGLLRKAQALQLCGAGGIHRHSGGVLVKLWGP